MAEGLKFEIQEEASTGTRIKVVGVGGGGSNAVAHMLASGVSGVEFHVVNTDLQALRASPVPSKLAIGSRVTNGLGAGSDPEIGRKAALDDTERIIELLDGADMVFVTAGLGGGTGTGAAPVVASLAREMNALTVAVVTKPFPFEGSRRMKLAERGLAELASTVDTVITIPNAKLMEIAPKGTGVFEAFRLADDVLRQAVQGISDIINTPGLINRDFSDIRAIMAGMGHAMMGQARGRGEGAAAEAARQAINCLLLEDGGVRGARGILINISGSSALSLHDVSEACERIRAAVDNDEVLLNFGIVHDESLKDEVKITVIATGFQRTAAPEPARKAAAAVAAAGALAAPAGDTPAVPQWVAERQAAHEWMTRVELQPGGTAPAAAPEPVRQPAEPPAQASATAPVSAPESSTPAVPQRAEELLPKDDLETPAFLRRDRRYFQ